MKYLSLTSFIFIILLSGCIDTEGLLKIEGSIMDEKTKKVIPNRKVNIIALYQDDDEYIPTQVGYFTTDDTGHFSYSFNRVKDVYYYDFCIVGDSSYAFSRNKIGLLQLYRNNKYLTFYASKLVDFIIKIERISKSPDTDTLYISWDSDKTDGKSLYPFKIENYWHNIKDNKLEFIGGKINAKIITKVYADKRTILHYKLFREGKYIGVYDTIFCSRNTKNNVNFRY